MKDFVGFRFGNIHTKDLQLVVVSSGSRYEKNLLPEINNYSTEVPGGNGSYYFGSTFKTRTFTVEVAFDSVDEKTWRKISQLFANDKLQELAFDEMPYKIYRAKIDSKPEFKFICFKDRETGERVYKGEGTLNFICYFPFAFGFNKYLVRAADYYLTQPPEKIIKEHYNVSGNMNTPWKGGYPTFEQVQKGELYFNTPDGEKTIIDVRGYWDNVPEWAATSKLLTTPTLDFDQELIFLPQYSRTNYMNMDSGLNKENSLIGTRLLVYNPGDLPIDFNLDFDNEERTFWTSRGNHFQIRRMNVERLSIPQAVDWTGLKTFFETDEATHKYGNRYFVRETTTTGQDYNTTAYEYIEEQHPLRAYIVEPIPRERLGHYIRLFYWQSSRTFDENGEPVLDFEEGEQIADRYEELFNLCISEEEQYELYWETLKSAILQKYADAAIFDPTSEYYDENYTYEDFVQNFLFNPLEFINDKNLDYEQIEFNVTKLPTFISEDYLEIKTEGIDNNSLKLDTEKRMLYNINKPEDFYNYKTSKNIYNDNIVKGKWFKIPTGWSLIEITPISEDENWGGKTWGDSRPFDWGYGSNEQGEMPATQSLFNEIYEYCGTALATKYGKTYTDENMNFRNWYKDFITAAQENDDNLAVEIYKYRTTQIEYEFLKSLQQAWKANSGRTGCTGKIEEWWWYACNYMWANFPPIYWTYADILNKMKISYIPLFY